jgi:hypothetical protein
MNSSTFSPECKVCTYSFNDVTNYFDRIECDPSFMKMPLELKVEETRKPEQIHSSQIVRGRIKDGKYLFFTGILPTEFTNLYFGDHYEFLNGIKKNSFILFHFTDRNRVFTVYFFNQFKLYPTKRNRFVMDQVQQINRTGLREQIKKKGGEFPTSTLF